MRSCDIAREVARRRTFAIISQPDAGKTTLTEKLLFYAGALDLAGAVRSRKGGRHTTSDWMAIEQQRGISITSTALAFDCEGCRFNLLDTPGHQDFSDDTYRTLMAVDSAVMVLDSAKGIEPQTRKLFEVCRRRRIPILTFINKLDHPGWEPLDLLDEIERVLGIEAVPCNWPIGQGPAFHGLYDLAHGQVMRFERMGHGWHRSPVLVTTLDDPVLSRALGEPAYRQLREELALLSATGTDLDRGRFLDGQITPIFFGSALNNFGVEPFLRALGTLAPAPGPRMSSRRSPRCAGRRARPSVRAIGTAGWWRSSPPTGSSTAVRPRTRRSTSWYWRERTPMRSRFGTPPGEPASPTMAASAYVVAHARSRLQADVETKSGAGRRRLSRPRPLPGRVVDAPARRKRTLLASTSALTP